MLHSSFLLNIWYIIRYKVFSSDCKIAQNENKTGGKNKAHI